MSTATDREYIKNEIQRMADDLGLSQTTTDLAYQVFDQALKEGYKKRDADSVATAVLFAACRLQGAGITVDEVEAVSRDDEQSIRTHYRTLSRHLGLEVEPNDAEPFFDRHADKLGYPEDAKQLGMRLTQQAKSEGLDENMAPNTLAGSIAYIVSLVEDLGYTQQDIERVTGVSESTLRKHWHDVSEVLQVDVPSRKGIDNRERDQPETPEEAYERLGDVLSPSEDALQKTVEIFGNHYSESNKHPAGLVGGAFYVATSDLLEGEENYSQQSVADALDVSLATVQNRVAEYREALE